MSGLEGQCTFCGRLGKVKPLAESDSGLIFYGDVKCEKKLEAILATYRKSGMGVRELHAWETKDLIEKESSEEWI